MEPWSPKQFTESLRTVGIDHYHDKHPFHRLMNEGRLSREQIRQWVANRFYYQKNLPIKDALILSRCPVREIRQKWIHRIIDHDGPNKTGDGGGIQKWLRLAWAVGLSTDDLDQDRLLLPGVRFAVDAYLQFAGTRSWIEAVASSLTELFAPSLMTARLAAFEKHYRWIDPDALAYFRSRPLLAQRDSEHGLELVLTYCTSRPQQEQAVAALHYKCDILWAQLDALYNAFVANVEGAGRETE